MSLPNGPSGCKLVRTDPHASKPAPLVPALTPRLRLTLAGALVAGAALRIGTYLARPSLFLDEAMLALNLGTRTYGRLIPPLDYDQTAPVPFLWAVKLTTALAGMNELALRLLPLLAGLATLFVAWRVAARVLPPAAAVLAVWTVATAPTLIQYGAMTKPYVIDALVAFLVLAPALAVLEQPGDGGAWRRLTIWGLVGVLCSFPSVFVLAAVGAGLVASSRVRRERAALLRLGAAAGVWAATFLALYVTVYRPAAVGSYVQRYWEATFLTPRTLVPGGGGWSVLARALLQVLAQRPLPPLTVLCFALILVAGAVAVIARRGVPLGLMLIGPMATLLAASTARGYPVAARLLLFTTPGVVLLIAWAFAAARERWPTGVGGVAVPGLAVALPLTLLTVAITHPFRTQDTRLAVRELERRTARGEPVYVISPAIPNWAYYTTNWSAPDTVYLRWVNALAGVNGTAFSNAPSRGRPVGRAEGAELEFRRDGRLELLGLPPGMRRIQVGGGTRSERTRPDSGWAAREAERIRAAARPVAWVFVAGAYGGMDQDLLAAVRAASGVSEIEVVSRGTGIYRFRFPPATR